MPVTYGDRRQQIDNDRPVWRRRIGDQRDQQRHHHIAALPAGALMADIAPRVSNTISIDTRRGYAGTSTIARRSQSSPSLGPMDPDVVSATVATEEVEPWRF